jgi:drug/metabolite transporter (DMT)-like permease
VSEARAGLSQPRILLPFAIVTLIWGSTWIVIKDQLGPVPASWSITYRFTLAAAGMFAYCAVKRLPFRIDRRGHLLAASFGLPQFFLNFTFVYAAEQYVTSGLVAVVFALLLVPNTLFGILFLKHRLDVRFLVGSLVAVAGVALLFVQELRSSTLPPGAVLIGIGLTLLGVVSASVSNVMQPSPSTWPNTSASLSKPAARPTGLGKVRPASATGRSGAGAPVGIRFSAAIVNRWARSASMRNKAGRISG